MNGRELSLEYTRGALGRLAELYEEAPLHARTIFLEKLIRAGAARVDAAYWGDALVHDIEHATALYCSEVCGFDRRRNLLASLPEVPDEIARCPELIGWCYQTWNEPVRDSNSWAISRKAEELNESADVNVLTQLFTDDYAAEFIVDRCLRLRCLAAKGQSHGFTICDPACGVGHMLLAALKRISHNTPCPGWIGEVLVGFDIDPIATVLTRALLFLQAIASGYTGDKGALIQQLRRSIVALPAPFGTLERTSMPVAPTSFDIVITNPPYLGRRKLSLEMREFLDLEYPTTNVDLCAAFMQRCIELCKPDGVIGLLTSDKWLRLKSYDRIRRGGGSFKGILTELSLDCVVELGAKAFHPSVSMHDGVKATIMCAVRRGPSSDHTFYYSNLALAESYDQKVEMMRAMIGERCRGTATVEIAQRDLIELGTAETLLRASDLPRNLLSSRKRLAQHADVVVGVQTSNDARYVRYVWQVPGHHPGWRIHSKGGGYGRWCGLNRWVIDWQTGAESFFKTDKARVAAEQWADRKGWTYTWFANGALGVRGKEVGWSFGRAAATGLFCEDDRIIAFLNSRFASVTSQIIGGKVQLPEGIVRALPIPNSQEEISCELVSQACRLKWEITRGDLCDAYYDPTLERDLVHKLVMEALLLVIEGVLERQVERALGMTQDESERWVKVYGYPVAWISPKEDIQTHSIWDFAHADCTEYRALFQAYADFMSSSRPRPITDSVQERIERRHAGIHSHRFVLPATGVVEHMARTYQAHPFDVVCALVACIKESSAAGGETCLSHVSSEITRDILKCLGHRWWSVNHEVVCAPAPSLKQCDIFSIVERSIERQRYGISIGSCVKTWIKRVLIPWQRKKFLGVPPVLFCEGKRGELSCAHVGATAE